MTMRNFGKVARGLLVAGALALSVSLVACTSSSGNNSGMGGNTGVITGTGGATAGTGGTTAGTGGMTTTDGGPDTGSTTDPHAVHLDIINKATTGGVPVTRPAPAVSYSDCKI
jgi:hypothetical protein